MKKLILATLLFISACATTESPDPFGGYSEPGGYQQFCYDFPSSVLCPEVQHP